MIPFPDISPEIFSIDIGGFEFALRWYAVSYIVGFICALLLMKYFLKREKLWLGSKPPMEPDLADVILTYLILGVIVGGRLGYVVFYNPEFYIENPTHIIRVWDGGMAFHGGFIGVVLSVIIYCKLNGLRLWSVADLIAISTPPGLFLGRVANFINSELWGRQTDLPWGVVFPGPSAQDCPGVLGPCGRHPSQLYEAFLEGPILLGILILAAKAGAFKRPGLLTGLFAIGYGFARYCIEFFRVPDPQFFSEDNPFGFAFRVGDHGITMGQTLSIPMVILGFLIIGRVALFSNVKDA